MQRGSVSGPGQSLTVSLKLGASTTTLLFHDPIDNSGADNGSGFIAPSDPGLWVSEQSTTDLRSHGEFERYRFIECVCASKSYF